MQHYIGLDERDLKTKRLNTPVHYRPAELINSHMLISGMSGSGKSYQVANFLQSAMQAGIEIDVFDAHDEFGEIPGCTACTFSQATGYGYNPLVLDTDPHTGGVNRQIDFFVKLIKQVTPQFGVKQEGALRNLLADTYALRGITQENRSTWAKRGLNEAMRERLLESGGQKALEPYYPTLSDLKAFAREKLIELTIGADNKCITAFEQLTKLRKRLNALFKKRDREFMDEEIEAIENNISAAKIKCREVYGTFIDTMETGREIDDVLKYDSADVLTSVLQRIILLDASGILSANEPPFNGSSVRVHQIKNISGEQQILYVKLRLQDIFDRCKRMGQVASGQPPRHIVFLDEAHKYFTNEPDDIINIIAKEARKFGLGLWCASQQPTEFPESFLTNVGTTILLGIHTSYWKRASSMFRISEESLRMVKPKEILAIKQLRDGAVDPPFTNVVVPNPNNDMGRRAASMEA